MMMSKALGKQLVRGVGLLSAGLLLSLSLASAATAAQVKKGDAKSAAAKPSNQKAASAKAAPAAKPGKATPVKAAAAKPAHDKHDRQAHAKGARGKADIVEAKASQKAGKAGRDKTARRALAEERTSAKAVRLAKHKERAQPVAVAQRQAPSRVERVASRETRLSLHPVVAEQTAAAVEPRAPRLSFGQMAGLHAASDPLDLKSSVALVMDQDTQEVLVSKNDHAVLPIASLTKLMTGLIVSDARLPLDEMVTITEEDIDTEKGSRSRLSVGTTLTRGELLHLALMSSENRAAHALGRTFPGGLNRFVGLMNARALMLGMKDTRYVEPTGLSSANRSSARDLATLVQATAQDPLLRQLTTSTGYDVAVGNRVVQYNNTNRLVHNPDWQIGLQKTGYISEAGQCLVMQARVGGRKLIMVFLDSTGKYTRLADAERVRRWIEVERPVNRMAANQYSG
ncbi:serine hydrolase [Ottowia sp. SB7-C50]|nr:serine hydrolase [Ottowia sp. SB7-C50]WOP14347.1 serine hydrolase [Ottowia sp. SB7-C50]